MHDYTVIEGLLRFALFLAAVSFLSTYMVCAKKWRIPLATGLQDVSSPSEIQLTSVCRSIQQSQSSFERGAGGVAGKASNKGKFAAFGDWLVPVIVWFLVITMALAIVGFLLGDK